MDAGSWGYLKPMNDASIEIRAALATGANRDFEFHTLRLDQPRADEVLVRIMAVGLCHTDISCRDSNMPACPAVLDHEGAGSSSGSARRLPAWPSVIVSPAALYSRTDRSSSSR